MMTDLSSTGRLQLAIGQLNPVMGDILGNLAKARTARAEAAALGADLLVLSELFICGYPPEDMVLKPAFQTACRRAVEEFAADTADGGPGVIIGTPWVEDGDLHNAVALLDAGRIIGLRYKVDLPNYGVFDEKRVFVPGPMPGPLAFRGIRLGLPICEDIWTADVVECLTETGAEILIAPNGSPWRLTVTDQRMQVAVARVVESSLPLIYVNQVGGQDELVFDGASFGLNGDRQLAFQLPAFATALATVVLSREDDGLWVIGNAEIAPQPERLESIWRACVLGLKDYVDKNRFPGVVLGLSGGIDSAVVAAMAVDALGADRVRCIMLPYRYTAPISIEDAAECAKLLGVAYDVVPIFEPVEGFLSALKPLFAGTEPGITEENLQSRSRGVILMAVSNKFGAMVLTTGNKSEMSVGYATLYGDMNGGYNPIKDIYKTDVFRLADFRNRLDPKGLLGPAGRVIPERIITRPPSAELRENQTDQDSLPPYDILDGILECLVEKEMPLADVVALGYEPATVRRVEHLLYIAEYKRRQAAPGVKITTKNFGRDRRYPITNGFRDRT